MRAAASQRNEVVDLPDAFLTDSPMILEREFDPAIKAVPSGSVVHPVNLITGVSHDPEMLPPSLIES